MDGAFSGLSIFTARELAIECVSAAEVQIWCMCVMGLGMGMVGDGVEYFSLVSTQPEVTSGLTQGHIWDVTTTPGKREEWAGSVILNITHSHCNIWGVTFSLGQLCPTNMSGIWL